MDFPPTGYSHSAESVDNPIQVPILIGSSSEHSDDEKRPFRKNFPILIRLPMTCCKCPSSHWLLLCLHESKVENTPVLSH